MVDGQEGSGGRRPRADAERNRVRLLDAAKTVFAAKGTATSLDEIARAAGVGAGTLYRHFPTRDALIGAVYLKENQQLAEAAVRLANERPPVEALREWLLLFIDYMAAKQGLSEVLNSVSGGASQLYEASGAQVKQAVAMLVDRASASGDIRRDLEPLDLLRAIAGLVNVKAGPGWDLSARRLVDVLMTGLQATRMEPPG